MYITTLQIYLIKWAIDVLLSIGTRPQASSVGQCKPFAQGILFSSIYPWKNQEFNLALLNWLRFAFVFVKKKYHVSPSILRHIFYSSSDDGDLFLPLWLCSVLCFYSITRIYLVYFLWSKCFPTILLIMLGSNILLAVDTIIVEIYISHSTYPPIIKTPLLLINTKSLWPILSKTFLLDTLWCKLPTVWRTRGVYL